MAKAISEFSPISSLSESDLVAVVDVSDTPPAAGTTKKATVAQIVALAEGGATPGGSNGNVQFKNGTALLGADLGVPLEYFGAVGDGVTNDQAAWDLAIAALAAGTYKTLLLGAKTYFLGSGGNQNVPDGCSIIGCGHSSVLKTTTNAPVIKVGAVNDVVLKDFKILGNGAVATSQMGVKMGVSGSANSGPQRIYIENVYVENVWQAGFFYVNNPLLGYEGPCFVGCRTKSCAEYGFYFAEAGEYAKLIGCQAVGSSQGIYIAAGNINCQGCVFSANQTNVVIATGSNDAHGIFSGCQINHGISANGIVVGAIVNGHTFIGCNIYDSGISLTSSVGVVFHDCVVDVPAYVFNGSTGTRFLDCVFPNSYANAVTDNAGGNASSTEWFGCRLLGGGAPSWVADRVQKSFTFAADANQTLTLQESTAETVIVGSGVISAARDIAVNVSPANAKSRRWLFINNNVQTVNVKFTSGTAVALTAGAKAVVGSDGTNAISLLS